LIRQDDDGGDFGGGVNDGKADAMESADRRYGNRSFERLSIVAEAHYPYLVYVTNSKHWKHRSQQAKFAFQPASAHTRMCTRARNH
jgi:hypothetical protein